ncbi:MAG: hypothetical protein HXS46_05205 [Theionarchaea archaeon]|nr:hypothetical protein [Theionarchaea archaeon]
MQEKEIEDPEKVLLYECPCFPCLVKHYNQIKVRPDLSETTISWFKSQLERCTACMVPWIGQYDYTIKPENFFSHKEAMLRCSTCLVNECGRLFEESYPKEAQLLCLQQARECINCMLDNIEGVVEGVV